MKRSITKAASVLSVAAALVLGLSACGSNAKERDASVEELTNRGFEDVKFSKDTGQDDSIMLFTGKVGTCRLDISRAPNGVFDYWTLPKLSEEKQKALDEKAGGKLVDTVNASYVEMYGADIGIGYCVPSVTK